MLIGHYGCAEAPFYRRLGSSRGIQAHIGKPGGLVHDIKRVLGKWGALAALAAPIALWLASPAGAVNADCDRLRHAIEDASRSGQSSQYQAAAERQRAEIDRTMAYAQQVGCDNKKFLFFGSDPPAQCSQIHAQIGRMRANLQDLQSRAGGGAGGRGELLARYNSQCAGQPNRSPGIMEALFGQPKPGELEEQPLSPDDAEKPLEKSTAPIGEARAGGKAVCVRSCDGAFFPVSYSASSSRLDSLADLCRALCPNAEVTLYTYPVTGDIEQALSINGARYMDSPTALRYRKTFDSSCSCRRRGQTWASALAPAESLLGQEDKTDIIVTPEKAAEMSRPIADAKPDPKAKGAKAAKATPSPDATPAPSAAADSGGTDANGVDMALRDATAAISHEGSGIAGAADASKPGTVGEDQGKTFDETGPDGVKRKVRVVGN
jgi:hypothetical protein